MNRAKILFLPRLGRSAWMSMKLGNAKNVKRKFNSPKSYNPTIAPELVKADGLETLIKGQRELLQILELAASSEYPKSESAYFHFEDYSPSFG